MMMLVNEMYADLERNAEEHGFLGLSTYHGSDSVTQPSILNVIYFRSLEQLLKWAHGKSHRDGWDWWSSNLPDLNEISIAHEVYSVPAGKWENIYSNSAPFDFGMFYG
jgi:heme-degrading monooxygenase HmoA